MIILIDNGHGADTKGKRSPDGELREAIWAREMAYDLMTALQKRNIEARMITPEMQDIALQTRVARINKVCAERGANNVLLVSLHLNLRNADDNCLVRDLNRCHKVLIFF